MNDFHLIITHSNHISLVMTLSRFFANSRKIMTIFNIKNVYLPYISSSVEKIFINRIYKIYYNYLINLSSVLQRLDWVVWWLGENYSRTVQELWYEDQEQRQYQDRTHTITCVTNQVEATYLESDRKHATSIHFTFNSNHCGKRMTSE